MYTLTNFVGCLKNNIRSKNEGYILGYCLVNKKTLRIFLKYFKGRSVINDIGCISLSGFRKY